ncbi:hypothetical protein H6771_03115 [Candidatus Peribacteria bacterium]|nr:hypothetical protein [Candidatus Peribacteria bacterium]
MKTRYSNILREWLHEHTGLFFAFLFILLGVMCVILYTQHLFAEGDNFLLGHGGIAFIEIGLTIIIVEEVVKPLRETKEQRLLTWEKKKEFVKKLERHSLDVLIWDFIELYEQRTHILHLQDLEHMSEEEKNTHRLEFLHENERYFTYFDTLRPYGGDGEEEGDIADTVQAFLQQWEAYFATTIESLSLLVSKPQLTQHHSWDYLVEFYALLRRHNHDYLLQSLTPEQQYLQLYIRALQFYASLLLDFSYYKIRSKNSHVLNPLNITFAEKAEGYWRMEQA